MPKFKKVFFKSLSILCFIVSALIYYSEFIVIFEDKDILVFK